MLTLLNGKKQRVAAIAASLVLLLPAVSQAGGYIGGSVGQAGVEVEDPTFPTSFDEEDFAWKIFAGYDWNFTAISLGIEGGYVDLGAPSGDIAGSIVEVDPNGWSGFGRLGFNLGPLGVFAKYGVIAWDADITVDGVQQPSDDGTDPAYGIGADIGLGPVEVRAEYEIFDIDDAEDVTMISVGITFSF